MERKEEREGEDEGSGEGLCDPIQRIAACEDFRLHMTALVLPCLPVSNVWQVTRNWKTATSRLSMLDVSIIL